MDVDREAVGYALLFSVPVGVGVAIAVLETTAGTMDRLALAGGATATVCIFVLVLLGAASPAE